MKDDRILPRDFGRWIHEHLQHTFIVIEQQFKSFKSETEITMKSLAEEVRLSKNLLDRVDVKLIDFLRGRKDLWKLLGVSKESQLLDVIRKLGFKSPSAAVIGLMRSDAILYDLFSGKIISLDFTSGLGRLRFIKIFEAADRADIPKLLTEFLHHAQREYVVRQAVLAYIFEGWSTTVGEVLYAPLPTKFYK